MAVLSSTGELGYRYYYLELHLIAHFTKWKKWELKMQSVIFSEFPHTNGLLLLQVSVKDVSFWH